MDARPARRLVMPLIAFAFAIASTACGAHGGPAQPQAPKGQLTVTKVESPEDAPEEAKTVVVEYAFGKDIVNKDFDKTFTDGFEKKGVKIDETLTAHAHFDVKDAKITGTVTYVKKGMGHYSILEADLVATGHYDADVQVDLDVQVKGDTKHAKEGDWDKMLMGGKPVPLIKNVMPTNIPIAGPLFLHAHFDLSAACDMELEGQMHATAGVGIAGDVRLAAKYKKAGFEPATPDAKRPKFQFEAKAPAFELAPKPYLEVKSGKQRVKGRCSLQPTAVLLLEHSIGAKLSVEPFVSLEAKRGSAREKWTLDAQAGVSVHAATDIEIFGRQVRKPKEFQLFEVALTKPGDEMGVAPRTAVAAAAPAGKAAKVELASVLGNGLGAASSSGPAPVSTKASMPKVMRGLFKKKK
ncbi:MAG TPA: hypothetical protein VLT33_32350 [Labilithrix sp.]|nr:hypothetical protein [Labilithrix sp.]